MSDIAHRGAQVASFEYNANRPWKIIFPPVYRYLPAKYVDDFFESGHLRLSSFSQFAKHADEARSDRNEGVGMIGSQGGGRTFGPFISSGYNSYVMCGSYILSKNIMKNFSGCDAVIEITNVPEFALSVSRQIAGFISGLSGYCMYANSRILVRHLDKDPFSLSESDKSGIPMERIFAAGAVAGQDEGLFLKQTKYSYQAEYRLIWNLDKKPLDYIDIVSPEARQFCRRVTADELG